VSLMNSIQQYPMQFLMPSFSPTLTANPEIAKAAQYGGGSSAGGTAQPQQGGAPASGAPAAGGTPAASASGSGGIMAQIMKLLSGPSGAGNDAIMSFLAGL
jgi:hypothetical protein